MKSRAILAGLVMLVMLLSTFAALSVPAKAAAAADEGVLYIAMQKDMPDFNTWNLGSNSVWKANVLFWGFESLFALDYNLLPYPLLVESYEFDEVNLDVTLHLRQDVTFHDGTPFTADDVVFTYFGVRTGTTYTSNVVNAFDIDQNGACTRDELLQGISKVDDYTVLMHLPRIYGQFFSSTLGVPIMAKHVWFDPGNGVNHTKDGELLDVSWNDPKASISTGPWRYKEGVANSYRIMEKYTGYWGKNMTSPMGYHLYPPYVSTLYFKIYASVDTAILALQSGQVDHIAWAVTAGRIPSLQADPSIGVEFLLDNGFFFVCFNMKKEPMNSLPFRKAVSHVIDKDKIVNVYAGGYASKGGPIMPPFWQDWSNESVETYPYNVATASQILNDSGFIDVNGDGLREMPDGRVMDKIVLLTPPADYDPIRIRAGQAIAADLRAIGINCEAKAIDFDTLVARMQGFDYQMLMIGYLLSSDPVGNTFDIVGPLASQNNFAFWSDNIPNPYYKDLLGVNTLADAETQALADKVVELGWAAKGTFNLNDQINATRWAEGLMVEALPINIMYYRVNVEAYSKSTWAGWMPFLGSIWSAGANYFLMSELKPAGIAGGVAGATASVNTGLSLPGKVLNGGTVDGQVLVIDNQGLPVSGAAVTVTVTNVTAGAAGVSVTPASGTTNSRGLLNLSVEGTSVGLTLVNVTASKGGVTDFDTAMIRTVDPMPKTLVLSAVPERHVMAPDESIAIDMSVTDENGDPVEGATVAIDTTQLGYGSVDTDQVVTDADGLAQIVYTAPAAPPSSANMHLPVSLALNVSKEGYLFRTTPIQSVMVKVDTLPDWRIASVSTVDTTALSSASNVSNIEILATDNLGNALADEALNVSYSNPDLVYLPTWEVTTDALGIAPLTVTLKDMADSAALTVNVANTSVANAVGASVTLTYLGTNPPSEEMYGGYLVYDATKYLGPLGSMSVTAYLWDSAGNPADGMNATLIVSGTSYGSLVYSDIMAYDCTWDGVGANLVTAADGVNLVTSGPLTDYQIYADYELGWGGLNFTAGEASFVIFGDDVAHVDVVGDIFLVPNAATFFNDTTAAWQIEGMTTVPSSYVIGRSYDMVSTDVTIYKPVMTARQNGFDKTTIEATVLDENGDPVEGAGVYLFQGFFSYPGASDYSIIPTTYSTYFVSRSAGYWGDYIGPSPIVTNADGYAAVTGVSVGARNLVPSVSMVSVLYTRSTMPGNISLLSQNYVVVHPKQALIAVDLIPDVQAVGSDVPIKVSAVDGSGSAVPNLLIKLSTSAGTLDTSTLATDGNGEAVFVLDTSAISGARAALITIDAKATGAAYEAAAAKAMIAVQNTGPSIVVTGPAAAATVDGPNVTVSGSVYDANGIQLVTLRLDTGSLITVPGTSGAAVWDISRLFTELEDGAHTLKVNATDSLGVSSEISVAFTTETPEPPEAEKKADILAWSVAIIGWIVAVAAIVLWLMRKPKGPEAMTSTEAEIEKEELKT